jgi:nicotinamidase-related amidase
MRHPTKNADLHGAVPDQSESALLILDLISDFAFDGGSMMLPRALAVAKRVARLKTRARAAGVPTIYVNDNFGRWRSSFDALIRHCTREGSPGAPIVNLIRPDALDYCVLKPKHSGFFATALATLLEYLGARRLLLTGASSHQCVLFTANDAYVRDFELAIPSDCICAATPQQTRFALRYFTSVLGADTRPSRALRLRRARRRRR